MAFYPCACACSLPRRTFLALGASVALGAVVGRPGEARARQPEPADDLRASLHRVVAREAADPGDPWALTHAVRALGRGLVLLDGRSAVDALLGQVVHVQKVVGRRLLFIDDKSEGHTNVLLKTFLEAGVPLETRFEAEGARWTLGDLLDSARLRFRFDPRDAETLRGNLAWSLIAFAHGPPRRWTNVDGQTIELGDVVEAALATYEGAMREFLSRLGPRGIPTQKSEIHRFTCGGTHLLYGLAACARAGLMTVAQRKRLEGQLSLHLARLAQEMALIDAFFRWAAQRAGTEAIRLPRADAMLKFLGHSLEVVGYAVHHGLLRLDADRPQAIADSRASLAEAVATIKTVDVRALRTRDRELAQHLTGDACHALRGVRLLAGERT